MHIAQKRPKFPNFWKLGENGNLLILRLNSPRSDSSGRHEIIRLLLQWLRGALKSKIGRISTADRKTLFVFLSLWGGHWISIYNVYGRPKIPLHIQQNIAQKNFAKRAFFRHFDSTQKSYEKRSKYPLFITFTVLGRFVFLYMLHNSL